MSTKFIVYYNQMSNLLFHFTNLYEEEQYPGFSVVDVRELSGTDLYCDEEAEKALLLQIKALSEEGGEEAFRGIHLIDSGNYHYMTRLFTSLIKEPYQLLVFDHHTDMKPAMFDMLSCGSWARRVLLQDENLRRLILVGPPEEAIREIPEECRQDRRLVCVSMEELQEQSSDDIAQRIRDDVCAADFPLYISVDKDVLSSEDTLTNWDQGNLPIATLLEILRKVGERHPVLGADICGGLPDPSPQQFAFAGKAQVETDLQLLKVLQR